ncbi:MAG: FMN-binding protein [Candidatus Neomarinimicrobiota bacterium]
MSTSARMIVVLTVIVTVSGGVLSSWDGYTTPRIQHHRLVALRSAIADVLPEHDHYEELALPEQTLYIGKKASGEPVGIAFIAQGSGFQGVISMMVGAELDFSRLTGIKVLEQIETPGLGTKIVVDPSNRANPYWFSAQFTGLQTEPEITVVKNRAPATETEIQAITGATISSRSVVKILNEALQRAKSDYKSYLEQVS